MNSNKSEVEGDGLWFGCGTVEKSGRLCEKTIELPPSLSRHPCFTVQDLSKDERFNQLPFVAGPPYFKFYAGTPLTTKKGINIGSLFIIDDVVRDLLTADQEQFLGTIAQTIMIHMETAAEAEERKKVMKLSLAMNAFVEGRSRLGPDEVGQDNRRIGKKTANNAERSPHEKRSDSGSRSMRGSYAAGIRDSMSLARRRRSGSLFFVALPSMSAYRFEIDIGASPSEPDTSQDDSDSSKAPRNLDTDHRMTFARAANLLCESLDLREHGGVVFFDTTSRLRMDNPTSNARRSQRPAEIVSYSTVEAELGVGDESRTTNIKSFTPLDESLIYSLLVRYPRGKMWTFDQDGNLSSSEEDSLSPRDPKSSESSKQSRANRKQIEAMLLQKHFPGVRQLLFAGLWDAGSSRWWVSTVCYILLRI